MHKSNWDDLRFVLAVVEAGSVNAAAARLGVNHATILRRISAAEARHGLQFFERRAAGYRVKAGAEGVIAALRGVEASVGAVERAIAGRDAGLAGSVTVTSTDTVCSAILPRHLSEFQQAYPAVGVTVLTTNSRLNLSRLDADVSIRPAIQAPADLESWRVGTLDFRVYASPGYWAANPSTVAADHSWLGVTELLGRSPVGFWQQTLPEDRITLRSDSFPTLAAHAQAGQGATMIPVCLGETWDNLAVSPDFPEHLETPTWVCAHRDLLDAPRVAACVDFLKEALSADPLLHR